jgi:NADH-quinone oxidoreductase subunit M
MVALLTTGFTFVISLFISYTWASTASRCCSCILTTFLMPLCILASWEAIQKRVKEYMIAFLILETLMVGVFCALDIVLFYVFFEGGLIPMFIIIGVWGGKRRVYASFKFFLYTLLGSVLMLIAIMAMYWDAGTTSIRTCWRMTSRPRCRPGCGSPSSPPSR